MNKAMLTKEREVIRTIRTRLPEYRQMVLAKKIKDNKFYTSYFREMAAICSARPLLSIYSVIRRHDAKTAKAAAVTA